MRNPPEAPPSAIQWTLPPWVEHALASRPTHLSTDAERMQLAVALAARNVAERTGGPFGAAVFESETGRVVAVGVNLVVHSRCSHAHAEMVALACAQAAVHHHDLAAENLPTHELVTSCEPCAMCLGATHWSGVRRLVCGATGADAERVKFDEGPKPPDWRRALEERGIEVVTEVERRAAAQVLETYATQGGPIYNPRRP